MKMPREYSSEITCGFSVMRMEQLKSKMDLERDSLRIEPSYSMEDEISSSTSMIQIILE